VGPKRKTGPHPPPDEEVNEPPALIEKESADVERDNPIEHDEPVEQTEEERAPPPTFEE